jgi:hypothetical protein
MRELPYIKMITKTLGPSIFLTNALGAQRVRLIVTKIVTTKATCWYDQSVLALVMVMGRRNIELRR